MARMNIKYSLESVKNRLIKKSKPCAIYLFGSYAWGKPHKNSDVDLLIVLDELTKRRDCHINECRETLMDLGISKDILVYTAKEFEERAAHRVTLCYKVKHEGKKIYGRL